MNHKLFSLVALVSFGTSLMGASTEVTPTFVARSQGRDAARTMVGLADKVHRFDEEQYVNFAATFGYTRSFRSDEIARCLFGDDLQCDGKRILVQGSDIENRDGKAWLADYFYLAPDHNSYFEIQPRIQNIILDLDLYVALDNMLEGLYFRAHGPINWSQWDLRFNEVCDLETTGSYDAGYFDSAIMLNNQLLGSFGDYASGDSPLNTNGQTLTSSTALTRNIGVQFLPLQFAKIDGCKHARTGFADLRLELGYDVLRDECFDLSVNVQVAIPTGNKTSAELAFDPTVGNRNHWEVGGGLYGRYNFYNSEDGDSQATLFFDLNLTHLNKANEERTFDLCGKPNSRYMLAQKMGNPVLAVTADGSTPSAQFESLFSPVANLTTLKIPVSVALQADMVLMLNCQYKKWSIDLGYNLFARTCENFGYPQELPQCCPSLCDGSKDQWALKGDAHVFGFAPNGASSPFDNNDAIPLSATQNCATIHSGTNAGFTGDNCDSGLSELRNCGVDNAQDAGAAGGGATVNNLVHSPGLADTEGDRIKTSLEPLFINCCDINLQRTRSISHKVFGHISYTWEKLSFTPYLGIGVSAEFGQNSDCDVCTPQVNCDQQCDNSSCEQKCCTGCLTCSLSQWGIYLKGGINFDSICG